MEIIDDWDKISEGNSSPKLYPQPSPAPPTVMAEVKQELKISAPPTPRSTHEHFGQQDGKNQKTETKIVLPTAPSQANPRLNRMMQRKAVTVQPPADPTKRYMYIFEDEKGRMLSVSEKSETGQSAGEVNAIAKAVAESPEKRKKALDALGIKFTRYAITQE